MALWNFRSFVSATGEEAISDWYEAQSAKVQAKFDARLRVLRDMTPQEWKDPYTKPLSGDCAGLLEIRFLADKVQHRPLGFFGPSRMEFTIVLLAIEKNDRLIPPDACKTALWRRDQILVGACTTKLYELE